METFDSSGRVLPVGATDQGIVSKKIMGKDGQEQGPRQHPQKKVPPVPIPEKGDDERHPDDHVIDIIV